MSGPKSNPQDDAELERMLSVMLSKAAQEPIPPYLRRLIEALRAALADAHDNRDNPSSPH